MLAMARSVCQGCSDQHHELGSRRPLQHAGGGPGIYGLQQVLLVLMHGVRMTTLVRGNRRLISRVRRFIHTCTAASSTSPTNKMQYSRGPQA